MPRKKQPSRKRSERLKRPSLPRSEPIRSWSTLFEPGANGARRGQAQGSDAQGVADPVRRGVELGYRVIDEYMKQGAAAANAFANPRMGALSGEDLPKMTERMMQYASDFTSLWFDAMGIMMGNMNAGAIPRPANAPAAAESAAKAPKADQRHPTPQGRQRLLVEVNASKPVRVIVALDEPLGSPLKVEPLRAQSGKGAITHASVEVPADPSGPLKVTVLVPARIRPDRYTGAVLANGTPRGRLTVIVSD